MKRVIKPVTAATGSSADMLEAFYNRLEEIEGCSNSDMNIEADTAITANRDDNYFGEHAAFQQSHFPMAAEAGDSEGICRNQARTHAGGCFSTRA